MRNHTRFYYAVVECDIGSDEREIGLVFVGYNKKTIKNFLSGIKFQFKFSLKTLVFITKSSAKNTPQ